MARTTHVKAARQRYATVPVIDPETGQPKRVAVTTKSGAQKTTKKGRPVFRTITQADHSRPLPNHTCGKCGKEIKVGDPYKHISPRSGPYGGRTLYRCAACPNWQVWEYSNSLSARLAQVAHDLRHSVEVAEDEGGVEAALEEAAASIQEIAEEKREGAENIRSGFGHDTYQSEELDEVAEGLDGWADEITSVDVPSYPEPEETECDSCGGTGDLSETASGSEEDIYEPCTDCEGEGTVIPDEPTEEQIDDWRSEVEDAISIIDEAPF